MNTKSLTKTERRIYEEARELLSRQVSAPEFSARFFGPRGRLRALWTTQSDRQAVVESALYEWLQAELGRLRRREVTQFEREVAELSGRLTVVVPRSLHAALKREAAHEGVSLSELIRLKLGVSYRAMVQAVVSREEPMAGLSETAGSRRARARP